MLVKKPAARLKIPLIAFGQGNILAAREALRVVVFDKDLCSLATDLLDTLRAASAIGITAPHIGVLKRLAVIELAAVDGVRTYVNPQIVWASADMIRHEEAASPCRA